MLTLYFVVLILLVWLSAKWIYDLAVLSSGITKKELWTKRAEYKLSSKNSYKMAADWFIKCSKSPKKTKLLLFLYYLELGLAVAVAFMAFVSRIEENLQGVVKICTLLMPTIIILNLVIGDIYKSKSKYDFPYFEDDFKLWKSLYYKKEASLFEEIHKDDKLNPYFTGILKLIALIAFMVLVVVLIISLSK